MGSLVPVNLKVCSDNCACLFRSIRCQIQTTLPCRVSPGEFSLQPPDTTMRDDRDSECNPVDPVKTTRLQVSKRRGQVSGPLDRAPARWPASWTNTSKWWTTTRPRNLPLSTSTPSPEPSASTPTSTRTAAGGSRLELTTSSPAPPPLTIPKGLASRASEASRGALCPHPLFAL